MSKNKTLRTTFCLAALLTLAACVSPAPPPSGRYESHPKEEAELVIYLKADGTLIRAEGLRGGIFEKESALTSKPRGFGKKIADIQIWEHDGNLQDLSINDGSPDGQSAHVHSGPVNPPWNTHCHRIIMIGTQPLICHCP